MPPPESFGILAPLSIYSFLYDTRMSSVVTGQRRWPQSISTHIKFFAQCELLSFGHFNLCAWRCPRRRGLVKVLGRRSGRLGFLKREKADLASCDRGSISPLLSQECSSTLFLNGYKNKNAQQGLMKSKPCKTHFSPGQLKLQVSPPLVSAPSDSPRISPPE